MAPISSGSATTQASRSCGSSACSAGTGAAGRALLDAVQARSCAAGAAHAWGRLHEPTFHHGRLEPRSRSEEGRLFNSYIHMPAHLQHSQLQSVWRGIQVPAKHHARGPAAAPSHKPRQLKHLLRQGPTWDQTA